MMDRRAVALLSAGHLGADLFLGAVPALVPLFVAQRGMSYAEAGLLVLAGSLASALMQPLAGLAGDRLRAPWLAPLGLLLTGGGLAAATLTSAFAAMAAALLVGGVGVAIFHPEAIRATRAAAGTQPGRALGIFAACGNVGFALGPALAVPLGSAFGLTAAGAVALVPFAAAVVLTVAARRHRAAPAVAARHRLAAAAALDAPSVARQHRAAPPADLRAFALATASAVALSACIFGLMSFVPAWFGDELGASVALGSAAVAGMLLAGAAGTYLAGLAGDAHGRGPVIAVALGALVPLTFLLPLTSAAPAVVVVLAIGLLVDGGYYPLLIVAQDALPERDGLAAGVVLGLSVGGGAAATALLGRLADAHGPGATLWVCAALAAASLALALPALRSRAPAGARLAAEPAAS
jgi:MFS transporter, FSR family, fosmidomycin resistance protein